MKNQNNLNILNKDALRSIVLAVLAVAAISSFLSWQYNKIAKSEEKLSSLEDLVERGLAQDALDSFMAARAEGKEEQANAFLTERAMEQKKESPLAMGFKSYSVIKGEKIDSDEGGWKRYEFRVKIIEKNEVFENIERVILIKILDQYYIDSVEIVG